MQSHTSNNVQESSCLATRSEKSRDKKEKQPKKDKKSKKDKEKDKEKEKEKEKDKEKETSDSVTDVRKKRLSMIFSFLGKKYVI